MSHFTGISEVRKLPGSHDLGTVPNLYSGSNYIIELDVPASL